MFEGQITPSEWRFELLKLEQLTSDPSNPQPGDEWLRVDQKPSYTDANGNTRTAVAQYRRVRQDGTTITVPVAQLGDATGSKVIDKVRVNVTAGGSPTGKGFVPYATSGASYPKRKLQHPVDGQVGLHNALTPIPDTVTSRPDDTNTSSNDTRSMGLVINPNSDFSGVGAIISQNTVGATRARLYDYGSASFIESVDISGLSSGDAFTFDSEILQGKDYGIELDANGNAYDIGWNDSASAYPYTGEDIDIVGQSKNGSQSTINPVVTVNDVGNSGF